MNLSYSRKFAATRDNMVQVFHAPGKTKEFNPFVLYRTFYGAYDETVCIDWTTDSRYATMLIFSDFKISLEVVQVMLHLVYLGFIHTAVHTCIKA